MWNVINEQYLVRIFDTAVLFHSFWIYLNHHGYSILEDKYAMKGVKKYSESRKWIVHHRVHSIDARRDFRGNVIFDYHKHLPLVHFDHLVVTVLII